MTWEGAEVTAYNSARLLTRLGPDYRLGGLPIRVRQSSTWSATLCLIGWQMLSDLLI